MKRERGRVAMLGAALVMTLMMGWAGAEELSPNANRVPDLGIGTAAGNPRLYNSAAGQLYPEIMRASVTTQRQFRAALPSIYSYSQTAHFQNRADVGSDAAYASAAVTSTSLGCPSTMCAPGAKWVMWDVPFVVRDTAQRKDGYLGAEQTISGFATGISRMLGESSAIGLAVGYDYRKLDGRDRYYMRDRADTFHAALFGGTNIGHFFVDGYAGYSRSWHRSERAVYHDETDLSQFDRNHANFNDTILSAGLKARYVWILSNDVRITPSVGFDYSHIRTGRFTERGWFDPVEDRSVDSISRLRVSKNSYNSVAVPVMVAINKTFSSGFMSFGGANSLWTPEVRGGYVSRFGPSRVRADVALASNPASPGAKFTARSTNAGSSYGTVGAGLKIKLRDKFIFAVDYDYSFASKYQNHAITGMYGVSF